MAGPLPAGWTENLDAASGRQFYYNAGTGETSWDRPQPAAGGGGALPEGWAEHLDAGSGRTFYYNAATGETAWEKPQSALAAASPAGCVSPAAGALPEGWAEHLDSGSGRNFYYNAATGVTAWEKPQATTPAASSADAGGLPEGWAEHLDPGSGRAFYCNAATGETAWEKPTNLPKTNGTWALAQANDLGRGPDPPMHILRHRADVLSESMGGQISGQWTSVARAVDALNTGMLVCNGGLCVLFSANKGTYWLLWRSDKEKEAESAVTATTAAG